MEEVKLTSGIRRLPVIVDGLDTGRVVMFNSADKEFAEVLYALVHRIGEIHKAKNEQRKAEPDILKKFEINRAEDQEMRAEVDTVFGEGFCADVFQTRLFALSDGMTVVENFLFALLDELDESITANMAKRDSKIHRYTEKYRKYK